MAGGGIKGGIVHGATDEVGYKAVDSPHYYSDLHATILYQLGLDPKKMKVEALGRTMKLVEEGGPIKGKSSSKQHSPCLLTFLKIAFRLAVLLWPPPPRWPWSFRKCRFGQGARPGRKVKRDR